MERRRQHEEAERKLLTPEEPGLYRPPLPRDYQPPSPATNTTTITTANPPPTPPQRNTSYLKTQVVSPDTLYTAKFVSYNDEEEEEEDDAGLAGQVKLSATRKSYGDLLPAQKPPPPPTARKPRPLSDGIFLSGSFRLPPEANANSTASKAGQAPSPLAKPKGRDAKERGGPHVRPSLLRSYWFIPVHLFFTVRFFPVSLFPSNRELILSSPYQFSRPPILSGHLVFLVCHFVLSHLSFPPPFYFSRQSDLFLFNF